MMYDGVIFKLPLDELYHHGIQGQHWGVRNGPPYPLGSDKSTGKSLKTKKSITDDFPGFKNMSDPEDPKFTDDWIKLQKLVENKSGDFYNSKPKTKRFRQAMNKYKQVSERRWSKNFNYNNKKQYEQFRKDKANAEKDIAKAVLSDLGYTHTKQNIDMISNVIFWD